VHLQYKRALTHYQEYIKRTTLPLTMFKRTSILHNAQMSLALYLIVSFLLKLTAAIITLSMRFRTYLVIKTTCVELHDVIFLHFVVLQLRAKNYYQPSYPSKAFSKVILRHKRFV